MSWKIMPVVRNGPHQPRGMTRKRSALKAVLGDIERPPDRSALFYWFVDHHDELARASRKRPMPWPSLCARFRSLGLTNRDGKPVTEETARKTWSRARAYVAQRLAAENAQREAEAYERATGSPAPLKHPSRTTARWQPMPVDPDHAPAAPRFPAVQQAERPGLLTRIGRSVLERANRPVEQPTKVAETRPAVEPVSSDLPKEGGPLTPEQVRAMKARLKRTLDERSGR